MSEERLTDKGGSDFDIKAKFCSWMLRIAV